MSVYFLPLQSIIFCILFSIGFFACQSKDLAKKGGPVDFTIMVLSDIHISNDESKDRRLADLISDINDELPTQLDFVVITGDNVSSFYSDRRGGDHFGNNRAAKLLDILNQSQKPIYLTLGNHDYKIDRAKDSDAPFSFAEIDTMEKYWKHFANLNPYYSMDYKGWRFIFLNSMRGRYLNRAFDDDQLLWLENELQTAKPSLLFFHHPIKTDHIKLWCKPKDLITAQKEPHFFEILEDHKSHIKGIFVGHGHRWVHDTLYELIPVFETDSFADNEKSPFYLVGIDTTNQMIHVQQQTVVSLIKE
jgi:predicted MPP superfamily phosphohydrolase